MTKNDVHREITEQFGLVPTWIKQRETNDIVKYIREKQRTDGASRTRSVHA